MKEIKKIEKLNSVKIGINARGNYSAEVKTYAQTPDEALKESCRIAKELEELIKVKNNEKTI